MNASEELQRLLFSTLTEDAAIMAIAGGVYDRVPKDPCAGKTAYIAFGSTDSFDDYVDCIDIIKITTQIDIFSEAVGAVECKRLVDLVRKKLHRAALTLSDNTLASLDVVLWRVAAYRDGIRTHGLVQVTATVEE